MLFDDVKLPEDLHHQAIAQHRRACRRARKSDSAKEMHRSSEILQQKSDRQDIEQNPERPAQAIMRSARRSRRILNRHLRHTRAVKTRKRRYEPVKLAVEVNVFQHLRAICLERRTEIAQVQTRRL